MTKIFICNNAANLKLALSFHEKTATVEAEFGATVVEGTVATLAHHGDRSEQPCPCLGDNINVGIIDVIGISHFDLDTLGGVMRLLGVKDFDGREDLFWKIAGLVDIMGVHKMEEIRWKLWREEIGPVGSIDEHNQADCRFQSRWDDAMETLNAFWAWSESNRLFPPRDGDVEEVSAFFSRAIAVLKDCDENTNSAYIEAGRKWAESKQKLEEDSFVAMVGDVILRKSSVFANHLYTHGKSVAKAIVTHNPEKMSVTISLANPIPGVNCCSLAQSLWGLGAGGHEGIAGSPYDQQLEFSQAELAASTLAKILFDLKK